MLKRNRWRIRKAKQSGDSIVVEELEPIEAGWKIVGKKYFNSGSESEKVDDAMRYIEGQGDTDRIDISHGLLRYFGISDR